jgi:hypothetical protein
MKTFFIATASILASVAYAGGSCCSAKSASIAKTTEAMPAVVETVSLERAEKSSSAAEASMVAMTEACGDKAEASFAVATSETKMSCAAGEGEAVATLAKMEGCCASKAEVTVAKLESKEGCCASKAEAASMAKSESCEGKACPMATAEIAAK